MLIENVHCADPGSCGLLTYLALGLGTHRCLFIVTDRGNQAHAARRLPGRAAPRKADPVFNVRFEP